MSESHAGAAVAAEEPPKADDMRAEVDQLWSVVRDLTQALGESVARQAQITAALLRVANANHAIVEVLAASSDAPGPAEGL